ncbi:MAG TPA: glutaredoxin family protein [Gammaproteobacteria bacterium]|nr:glutaredoxin family protein [Gammaproteobacteria bacterium]
MHWQLQELAGDLNIRVDWVDIDSDPALAAEFGTRIPVLMAENTEICHYTLDMAALNAYLDRRSSR